MLEREIADPRIGFATVTEVETTPDLRHAKVWVSVIGGTGERDATIAGLEHAMVFVRRELGTRLRIRRIPELHVRLDDSIERGTRVLRLLDSLETGAEPDDSTLGESLPTPATPARSPLAEGFGAAAAEFAAAREHEREIARERERQAAGRDARAGRKGVRRNVRRQPPRGR